MPIVLDVSPFVSTQLLKTINYEVTIFLERKQQLDVVHSSYFFASFLCMVVMLVVLNRFLYIHIYTHTILNTIKKKKILRPTHFLRNRHFYIGCCYFFSLFRADAEIVLFIGVNFLQTKKKD